MLKKPVLSLLLFLLAVVSASAQSISGKVVNEQNEPIAYATIQLKDDYGVISNSEGEFTLVLPKEPGGKVTISFLGFESLEIPVSEFSEKTYVLQEKVTELDQVVVSNRQLNADEIVEKMITTAPELHSTSNHEQLFFMRDQNDQQLLDFVFEIDKASQSSRKDLREINAGIEQLTRSIKDSRFKFFTEYYGQHLQWEDSSKLRVQKAVILKDRDRDISAEEITKKLVNTVRPYLEKEATYKVKTGIIKIEDSLKTDEIFDQDIDSLKGKTKYVKGNLRWRLKEHNEFFKNEELDFLQKMNRYNYVLEGYADIGGEPVYIIRFDPERSSAAFAGKMYIHMFDYGMMRLEYEMLEGEKMQNVNLKFLLGIKYREDRIRVISEFRKNEAGKYYLKFGRRSSGEYAYISRPLKFIKNRTNRSDDRQVFKMDFTFELDNYSTSEIYIAGNNDMNESDFRAFETQENFEPIETEVYDATLWEGYNIIAPIEDIKNYGRNADLQ
ncbi:carboxypeptidase-like regulatory domain-containing protein [Robertkochia aurantiaca]|uniref:carboxypeptidase-like regulatory domain-containing protein n=1 Tax=Robertkochia aurantiaca TaxID=2873700 RepID=UPI001CCEE8C7|nr:carboxypeptidase-like regulatory domain-containing protein [Robertkochia sp. 3YJGBD-33]